MNHPQPSSPTRPNRLGHPEFRAVQGDTAITCVDWQAFHAGQDGDPAFTGLITVLDNHDRQHCVANWSSPTDDAADTALGRIGWQRVGPWNPDHNGRRSATVQAPTT